MRQQLLEAPETPVPGRESHVVREHSGAETDPSSNGYTAPAGPGY